jgi:hypothetical protein
MGNFMTKPAKWRIFSKRENDKDGATKSNWICNDHLCPNPYTHARGDPCKLTMKDLFPSRPEPPTSEVTNQPENESEDWLIEWDRENRDITNQIYSRKLFNPKTNKRTYTTLTQLLLALNH